MTDRPHTTKALNRMCCQANTHASPRHKRGPGHRPAQTHLPQVCETCVGTLRQTHRNHKARPTHTSPSGTGTPPCQATWDMGHHSQPSHTGVIVSLARAGRQLLTGSWQVGPQRGWKLAALPACPGHPSFRTPCLFLYSWPPPPHSLSLSLSLTDSSRVCEAEDRALGYVNGPAASPLWSGC